MDDASVLVQVVAAVDDRRQIDWNIDVAERLASRIDDVRQAVRSGTAAIAESLPSLAAAEGWRLSEVSATFGVSLTAEAGVIISKAEAGATFDVSGRSPRRRHCSCSSNPATRGPVEPVG